MKVNRIKLSVSVRCPHDRRELASNFSRTDARWPCEITLASNHVRLDPIFDPANLGVYMDPCPLLIPLAFVLYIEVEPETPKPIKKASQPASA